MPAAVNTPPQAAQRATRHRATLTLAAAVVGALLSACGPSAPPGAAAGPGGAAPPPAEVGVVVASLGTVGLLTELPGRTEASRVAQVRARVAGIVQRQLFREGSEVKAGQPLFQIDAAPYQATLASARATLARAEANLMQTQAQATRYKPLVEANAISQQDYVAAVAAQKLAEADVAAGKAAVQTAQINLGYAAVNSPISGRVGRALVTEGALVGQGEVTQLAVVQQIDPLFINITQPVADVMRLRAALASGKLQGTGQSVPVRIVLDDGEPAPAGAPVELVGDSQEFFVARRGEAFITGLQPSNTLRIQWKGASCTFKVDLPAGALDDIARVGPITCSGVKR